MNFTGKPRGQDTHAYEAHVLAAIKYEELFANCRALAEAYSQHKVKQQRVDKLVPHRRLTEKHLHHVHVTAT